MVPVSRTTVVAFLAALVFIGAGCLPDAPTTQNSAESPAPTPSPPSSDPGKGTALFKEWLDLAAKSETNPDHPRPYEITAELAANGPETLFPMIAYLGDPDAPAMAKLLAVRCLTNFLAPEHLDPIHRVFKEQKDETSRACAIALLGLLNSPDAVSILQAALQDEQPRVRFAAMSGLVNNGDRTIRSRFADMGKDEATSTAQRLEIVRVLLRSPQPEDVPVFKLGIGIEELDSRTRINVAMVLGKMGDESVIEALEKSLELDSDPIFQGICRSAIKAIEERESEPTTESS